MEVNQIDGRYSAQLDLSNALDLLLHTTGRKSSTSGPGDPTDYWDTKQAVMFLQATYFDRQATSS
jgi:hypothetical protein